MHPGQHCLAQCSGSRDPKQPSVAAIYVSRARQNTDHHFNNTVEAGVDVDRHPKATVCLEVDKSVKGRPHPADYMNGIFPSDTPGSQGVGHDGHGASHHFVEFVVIPRLGRGRQRGVHPGMFLGKAAVGAGDLSHGLARVVRNHRPGEDLGELAGGIQRQLAPQSS